MILERSLPGSCVKAYGNSAYRRIVQHNSGENNISIEIANAGSASTKSGVCRGACRSQATSRRVSDAGVSGDGRSMQTQDRLSSPPRTLQHNIIQKSDAVTPIMPNMNCR